MTKCQERAWRSIVILIATLFVAYKILTLWLTISEEVWILFVTTICILGVLIIFLLTVIVTGFCNIDIRQYLPTMRIKGSNGYRDSI